MVQEPGARAAVFPSFVPGSCHQRGGEVGGGGDGISAYHYIRELDFDQDKFKYVKIRIKGIALGWFSVSQWDYKDIRVKWSKIPSKYRV
jgi:hypothetical protein